jgi:N-acetylmuramoyl-L-alanine amidase
VQKKLMLLVLLCFFLFFIVLTSSATVETGAYSYTTGDSGPTVREIQTRLKNWGYYKGSVDGYYGPLTVQAVIYFQQKHRVYADGRVGPQTAALLGISLGAKSASSGTGGGGASQADIYLLARVVYAEGRGESYKGQVAIAAVVLNRVASSQFPNTIAKVVYQPGAFSVVNDGQINLAPDQTALKAARDAMNGWDPSGGALFYFNPAKTTNAFLWSRKVTAVIGNHRFTL